MLIGVPKEIKNHENRVGMAPASVREAIKHGHQIMVETNAGSGIGVSDAEYAKAGAEIIDTPDEIFTRAGMIVKVKEPQAVERKMLREGQVLFTYLHLAPDPEQTGCTGNPDCDSGTTNRHRNQYRSCCGRRSLPAPV